MAQNERPGSIGVEHGAGREFSGNSEFSTTTGQSVQDLASTWIAKRYGLNASLAGLIAELAGFLPGVAA